MFHSYVKVYQRVSPYSKSPYLVGKSMN
jgi:hypothetical protein